MTINKKTEYRHLGLIDYKKAWDYQEELFNETVSLKIANRKVEKSKQKTTRNHLLFVYHPHVYTLGKSGDDKNFLLNETQLKEKEATFYKISRGGDITYHGPGQIVGYPILDLDNFFTDIHQYLRYLEEVVIRTLAEYEIIGERIEGLTGVWLDADNKLEARKICAFGVKSSRWVTMHGFALNVNVDLSYFGNIVPCGIQVERLRKSSIVGSFAELGVHTGVTARAIHYMDRKRQFYLFDTFQGFSSRDLTQESQTDDRFSTETFANTSVAHVKDFIKGNNNLIFRPGFFPDTAKGLENEKFALVNIDADLYAPTIEALKFFYPRLVVEGVIIVHDYNHDWNGIRKALNEFLPTIPESLIEIPDWQGSAMIIKNSFPKL